VKKRLSSTLAVLRVIRLEVDERLLSACGHRSGVTMTRIAVVVDLGIKLVISVKLARIAANHPRLFPSAARIMSGYTDAMLRARAPWSPIGYCTAATHRSIERACTLHFQTAGVYEGMGRVITHMVD
jgi:hypothetical protein